MFFFLLLFVSSTDCKSSPGALNERPEPLIGKNRLKGQVFWMLLLEVMTALYISNI